MDDLPLQKIAISGTILASIIQRFSSASGDVDGLLFGHITAVIPSNLPDDDIVDSSSLSESPTLVATITNYFCSGTVNSFYDAMGRVDFNVLQSLLSDRGQGCSLIGWFIGRRKTPLRTSMREFSISNSLSNGTLTLISSDDPLHSLKMPPCVFIVFSTPLSDQLIHTHEHRAFQFRRSTSVFEPKSMDIVNIGPAFRGHYSAFCPNSPFPHLPFGSRDFAERVKSPESLNQMKRLSKEQPVLNLFAEGFEVGQLSRLIGSQSANYTSELEDMYGKMLSNLEGLARVVDKSSAEVLERENQNVKLRCKVAGLE